MEILAESIKGVIPFITYFLGGSALLAVFLVIYIWFTPYHEIRLIREGNTAAAISLGGTTLGLALPLASAIEHSVVIEEMLMWGAIAMVVQFAVYLVSRLVLPDLGTRIPEGSVAHGIFLGALAVAAGFLNAASMTY